MAKLTYKTDEHSWWQRAVMVSGDGLVFIIFALLGAYPKTSDIGYNLLRYHFTAEEVVNG